MACVAQDKPGPPPEKEKPDINWLYGAYVPKDQPLLPLNNHQRARLFVAQTFTTPGIYIKTIFLSSVDQGTNSPSQWGQTSSGYAKRLASQHATSMIQNSFSSVGNAILRYEPRYDRCRCEGKWGRVRHAVARNFVTYNRTEKELRPQFALYTAAVGSGMISSTWQPDDRSAWSHGWHNAVTQTWVGTLTNLVGEFAPEIGRLFKRKKKSTSIQGAPLAPYVRVPGDESVRANSSGNQ
jgi:hypothetical protein